MKTACIQTLLKTACIQTALNLKEIGVSQCNTEKLLLKIVLFVDKFYLLIFMVFHVTNRRFTSQAINLNFINFCLLILSEFPIL